MSDELDWIHELNDLRKLADARAVENLALTAANAKLQAAAPGLTALAAKWREASDDVHCGTLAERKVLRRCADELEVTLRGVK